MCHIIRDQIPSVSIIKIIQKIFLASMLASVIPTLAAQPLPVVASFSVLADMVREVGGAHVEVISLVGPNTDAHVFDPTPADAKRIASARLVFVNGLGFEGWLDRLVKASGYRGPLVIASKGLKAPLQLKDTPDHAGTAKGAHTQGSHGVSDPHAWQNLANAEQYVETIRNALVTALPVHDAALKQRAADYIARIRALDQSTQAQIAAVPVERRRVITSHDAFGYFAKAYDIDFIAPQGVSTDAEATAQDVAKIIRQIKADKIPAVFLENVSDDRLIRRIGKESGAKIGGKVFSDALSETKGPAGSYIDMMRNNIREFTAALKP